MKKKLIMATVAVLLLNNSVAFASIDKKVRNSDFKIQCPKLTSIPGFYKTSIESTISIDLNWEEICTLYKEYRTTGKKGFSQSFLKLVQDKDGFVYFGDKYNYDSKRSIDSLISSNKDCELIIDKFLKKASRNTNDIFKINLKYRITLINYELELYPNEVESIELLSIDI